MNPQGKRINRSANAGTPEWPRSRSRETAKAIEGTRIIMLTRAAGITSTMVRTTLMTIRATTLIHQFVRVIFASLLNFITSIISILITMCGKLSLKRVFVQMRIKVLPAF